MKTLLILPVVIPLIAAAVSLLLFRRPDAQRRLCMAASAALFAVGAALLAGVARNGIQVVQVGGWPAPFGITFVADILSAVMVFVAGGMGLCIAVYSVFSMDAERVRLGWFPLVQVLMMGVCGAFLTGDIFNLYVWFEVMLMASFVLLALGGDRPQLEGAIKYVTINLISSAIFLSAAGILYGKLGTLNMADLAVKVNGHLSPGLITALSMLFLVAFGIKAALFPLFFWLPASYHTPPVVITALFSALLTKVGAYALIRMFTLVFTHDLGWTHPVLLAAAGLTMLTGVLGAAARYEFRKILAFHIVSQIGYIIMGLALHTGMGLAGSVYFMVHNIIAKTNLFLIAGVAHRVSGTYELKEMGGLYKSRPWLSVCFFLTAMSLAGAPPLSGFFGKLALILAGVEARAWGIVAVSLVVSVLTLFSMTKIWAYAFWKPAPADAPALPHDPRRARDILGMMLPVTMLTAATVLLGVFAESCMRLALAASAQLIDPAQYVNAVMGGAP